MTSRSRFKHRLGPSTALTALCLLASAPASADAPLNRSFSSLCTDAEEGEIAGLRIRLTGTAPDLSLSFEEPEGAIVAATTTKDVSYAPASGQLRFKLRTDDGTVSFEGRLADTVLEGTLTREDGTKETVKLPPDKGGDGEAACASTSGAETPAKTEPPAK